MKKHFTLILAGLVVVLFALVSCQVSDLETEKESVVIETAKAPLVFTASIAQQDTKTTLSIEDNAGKIAWNVGDEITVTDKNSKTATYKISSSTDSVSGTFTLVSSTDGFGGSPYTATYGTEPSTSTEQTYNADGKVAIHMTAPSTNDTKFTFTADCGVLKINLTDATHSVTKIEVSDSCSFNTYTLNCGGRVSISEAKDFFIAVPKGVYKRVKIYSSDSAATKNTRLVVETNKIKPAKAAKFNWIPKEYTELSYLQSSGTQYINTGVFATDSTGFYVVAQKIEENKQNAIIIGSRTDSEDTRCWINVDAGNNLTLGWGLYGGGIKVGTDKITVKANYLNDRKFYYNGEESKRHTEQLEKTLSTHTNSLYLFAANNIGTPNYYWPGRLWKLQITKGNSIDADFIPVRQEDSGTTTLGLYDLVTGTFKKNDGTGTFTAPAGE